ncbi:unnamed protein product [Effrenium voratum]|nr:unnamed protein product [Effrenium voratum]
MDPMSAMMAMMMMGGGGKGMGGKGTMGAVKGDPKQMVYVGNLDFKVTWQALKDHMKQAGKVQFCSVLTEDGTEWSRSKGMACVRFETEQEANNAIQMLNGVELQGRPLKVDHWQLLSLNCVALSSYERPLAAEMCFA